MTQKSMSFDDIMVVAVKGHDYRIHFWFMSKNKAVDRMKYAEAKKSGQV